MFGIIKEVVGGSEKIAIKPTMFPDKTSQVWHLEDRLFRSSDYVRIFWDFENEGELIQVLQLAQLFERDCVLELSYLPYGRQDKEVSNETTFALQVFADVIDDFFMEVRVLDPHSYALQRFLSGAEFEPQMPERQIRYAVEDFKPDMVCYADESAKNKYLTQIDCLRDIPYLYGKKVREQSTGYITSYEIMSQEGNLVIERDAKVLVVDDIGDGCSTHCILAKSLKLEYWDTLQIGLYVTHGIFSKGLDVLRNSGYTSVYDKYGKVY